jgi:hypothetical protein
MNDKEGLRTERKYLDYYFETENIAGRMYKVLTSNRFSRDVPSMPEEIKEKLREKFVDSDFSKYSCSHFSQILVGLWGGYKENKNHEADQADSIVLDNLCKLREEVNKVSWKNGLEMVLLFCDLHHIVANNQSLEETEIYFKSLEKLTEKRKIYLKNLSLDLYKMEQLRQFINPLDYISDISSRKKATQVISNQETFKELIESAKKHSLWIKQGIGPEKIARLYIEMEIYFLDYIKKKGIKLKTDKYETVLYQPIFFSFSDPVIQKPIAEAAGVPMLYLKSNCPQHGFNECPWYVDLPF